MNFKVDRMCVREPFYYSGFLGIVLLLILIGAAGATGSATGFAAGTVLHDPDVDSLLEEASERITAMEEDAARSLFEEVLEIEPENHEALWKLSLLYSKEGYRHDDRDVMDSYYEESIDLAEQCLENFSESASCHYVYAVALGRSSEHKGPRTRIRTSREIKEHIEQALDLDPDHPGAWHLLGVWHASAANLSGGERFAANLLFGGAPEGASNEAAELALQQAIDLSPDRILFRLDLARFYRDMGWCEDAAQELEVILQMESQDQDDPRDKERAERMLSRLSC